MMDTASHHSTISQAPYRPFGAFRFILALAVVFGHGAWLVGGGIGELIAVSRMGSAAVLSFFVLSGFILAEAASTFYAKRWRALTVNRVLKILPAFLGALVLSLAAHWIIARFDLIDRAVAFEGGGPVALWTKGNLGYNLLSIIPFFRPDEAWHYFGRIYLFVRYVWAINVEVLFYTLLAIYVAVVPGSWGQRAAVAGVALLVGAILLRGNLLTLDSVIFYLRFAPFFLLGIAIYITGKRRQIWAYAALAFAAAASLIIGFEFIGTLAGTVIFILFLVILVILSRTKVFFISRAADRQLGDLSYSLYLNHYVVLVCIGAVAPPEGILTLTGGIFLAVVVAMTMQAIIERPLMRARAMVRGVSLS